MEVCWTVVQGVYGQVPSSYALKSPQSHLKKLPHLSLLSANLVPTTEVLFSGLLRAFTFGH